MKTDKCKLGDTVMKSKTWTRKQRKVLWTFPSELPGTELGHLHQNYSVTLCALHVSSLDGFVFVNMSPNGAAFPSGLYLPQVEDIPFLPRSLNRQDPELDRESAHVAPGHTGKSPPGHLLAGWEVGELP